VTASRGWEATALDLIESDDRGSFAAVSAIRRARMAAGLLRLARRRDRSSRALARALKGTAFAGLPSEEQVWIDRLESYRRECTFLMRLVRELKPGSCVELGTGFGVSTAYQAASLELNGTGRLITLDAATEWMKIAERGLSMLGLDGIVERRVGPIDGLISEVLPAAAPIDYALLDADHAEEATLRHFEAIFPHLAEGAVAVFDDINWTEEMQRAWARVGRHDGVSIALDIGRLGVAVVSRAV
jgi:predicted O-methyltransferase YrrM